MDINYIIEKNEYDPLKIGVEILRSKGYVVEDYLFSDSLYVYKKEDKTKILYYK